MIAGRRVLAVVPARGGSKGLPRKNVRIVAGIPLVGHVARCVEQVPEIDRTVVSTDDDEIVEVSERSGLAVPFRRPDELAGDRVADHPVLEHALMAMEAIDEVTYDLVVMLQPTSPTRTPDHLRDALRITVERNWDSLWSVSPTDPKFHPDKQLEVHDGRLDFHTERGRSIVARQELTNLYHRNGIVYVMTRECILAQRSIHGRRAGAMVIEDPVANIDSALDLAWAEFILGRAARQPFD